MRRRLLPTLLVLLVAGLAQGGVLLEEQVATSPSAAIPVTLAAGTSGSTTLGASATSAATTASLPVVGSITVLKVERATGSWSVRIEALSATGFSVLESATVTLVGATTQAQVVVTAGSLTQSTGSTVVLDGTTTTLTVLAAGTFLGTGILDMRIVLVPSAGPQPDLRYDYDLTFS
ncbi:MAG TPA: hypothetical protein VI796_00525 [Candidatus Thermoplasmatota archaeon]|nr:hypothetical protein [Candidatus Thermoplasmatota archaeon]